MGWLIPWSHDVVSQRLVGALDMVCHFWDFVRCCWRPARLDDQFEVNTAERRHLLFRLGPLDGEHPPPPCVGFYDIVNQLSKPM